MGFPKQFHTPHGVVFLKQKKSWRKGRAAISYFRSIAGTLLRATSKALDIVLLKLLPQRPGQLSIPNLWKHLHTHFSNTPHDLISPPSMTTLSAFSTVFGRCSHQPAQPLAPSTYHYYPPPATPFNILTLADTTFTTHTTHIPLIVQQALHSCIFQACHTYFQQMQGAGIGSQLSPAIMPGLTYHTFLQQPCLHLFNARYVDNRYILLKDNFIHSLPIATLAHPELYGHPVEIEAVEDDHLLGFFINPQTRKITFQLPTHPWQIRDNHSAGSHRLRLSGLQSRHHTLQHYTYPPELASTSAQALVQLYATKGHSPVHCAAAPQPSRRKKDLQCCCLLTVHCCTLSFQLRRFRQVVCVCVKPRLQGRYLPATYYLSTPHVQIHRRGTGHSVTHPVQRS